MAPSPAARLLALAAAAAVAAAAGAGAQTTAPPAPPPPVQAGGGGNSTGGSYVTLKSLTLQDHDSGKVQYRQSFQVDPLTGQYRQLNEYHHANCLSESLLDAWTVAQKPSDPQQETCGEVHLFGINTDSPEKELDVRGSISASGDVCAGGAVQASSVGSAAGPLALQPSGGALSMCGEGDFCASLQNKSLLDGNWVDFDFDPQTPEIYKHGMVMTLSAECPQIQQSQPNMVGCPLEFLKIELRHPPEEVDVENILANASEYTDDAIASVRLPRVENRTEFSHEAPEATAITTAPFSDAGSVNCLVITTTSQREFCNYAHAPAPASVLGDRWRVFTVDVRVDLDLFSFDVVENDHCSGKFVVHAGSGGRVAASETFTNMVHLFPEGDPSLSTSGAFPLSLRTTYTVISDENRDLDGDGTPETLDPDMFAVTFAFYPYERIDQVCVFYIKNLTFHYAVEPVSF